MKREVYLWIALFVAVAAVGIYFRFYYQPQLSLKLVLAPNATSMSHIYPYQKLVLPFVVDNTGGVAAENLSVGGYLDGNITTLYRIHLPAGKQEDLEFNYTPTAPGVHSIYIVIDPDNLYDIADRAATMFNFTLTVMPAENLTPEMLLPSNGITSQSEINTGYGGFLIGTYLYDGYGIGSMNTAGPKALFGFLSPFLNLTSAYFSRIGVAYASYKSGAYTYSLWMQGYIEPYVTGLALESLGYTVTNVSSSYGTVTYSKLNDNFTVCSWYSGGWIKILFWNGTGTCLGMLNNSNDNRINYSVLYDKLVAANSSVVTANSTTFGSDSLRVSALTYANGTFTYRTIWANNTPSNKCNGLISVANGMNYCSEYLGVRGNATENVSALKTWAGVGTYNLSVLAVVNSSKLLQQSTENERLIRSLNISGKSANFTYDISSLCDFSPPFSCTNVTYYNGTITLWLKNTGNSTRTLNSIGCNSTGAFNAIPLDTALHVNQTTSVSTTCYDNGVRLSGIYVTLALNLRLDYTVAGKANYTEGKAFINVVG